VASTRRDVPGAAHLNLVQGVPLLHEGQQVLAAMLQGWRQQQQSRGLSEGTISGREEIVRRFQAFTNDYPWNWAAQDVEEWSSSLCSKQRAQSTLRQYQQGLALFMAYLTDPRYDWAAECERRFGTHPVQICHEWNTIAHVVDSEGRPGNRPLTREELQRFFDYADERIAVANRSGRKGWLAAFRDATLFKTIYAWGLRRREAVMLDTSDCSASPAAPEFGRLGKLHVRYGKATRGSPPRRRTVLTVMPWSVEVLAEYLGEVRPRFGCQQHPALWLTERGERISTRLVNDRFTAYRRALGLPEELGPHCLRHSYVTHLIEDGFDHRFVQEQVGHAWGATTSLYTGVSTDFKNQSLRSALNRLYGPGRLEPLLGERPGNLDQGARST
jgi:integrase/recombinase XerC